MSREVPGYADQIYPTKHTRSICTCGWMSAKHPRQKEAKMEFDSHHRSTHE